MSGKQAEATLKRVVYTHYAAHGRHDLPWRQTTDPYRILVSEVMLQQTQVSRVLNKYRLFLRHFPNTKRLANAPLAEVLQVWQGLGYNRRAKLLQQSAQVVTYERAGRWPKTDAELQCLPGVGPYTAGAVLAFAYGTAVPMVETNIRTVYLHHLFPRAQAVSEADILAAVDRTLDRTNPREWYWALMDYGSYLKQTRGNNIQRAASYKKQSPFAGSRRQIRGAVLRLLSGVDSVSDADIVTVSTDDAVRQAVLEQLLQEGMVCYQAGRWQLPR